MSVCIYMYTYTYMKINVIRSRVSGEPELCNTLESMLQIHKYRVLTQINFRRD